MAEWTEDQARYAQYQAEVELRNGHYRSSIPDIDKVIDWVNAHETGVQHDFDMISLLRDRGYAEGRPDPSAPPDSRAGGSPAAEADFREALRLIQHMNATGSTEMQHAKLPYLELQISQERARNLDFLRRR